MLITQLPHIARSPALSRLLENCPQLNREHHWEGDLTITRAVNPGFVFKVKASIGIHGDLIDGTGRSYTMPYKLTEADGAFTLSGSLAAGTVAFQLWFSGTDWRQRPFVATGHIGVDGREMSGDWTTQCMQPTGCGCAGLGGPFRLQRVD